MTIVLRTIAEWIADARAARDGDQAERCLTAAAAQATDHRDWEAILDGAPPATSIEFRRQLAARALAAAEVRQEIWGFPPVARMQADDFGDRDGAKATLRLGERMLDALAVAGQALGFQWGILAAAYRRVLSDDAECRRLLSAGWEVAYGARDVENLGRLVNQWNALPDRDEALARMRRVEAAAREWGQLGGIIYWWHAIGEPAAARRARQLAVDETARFDEALELAQHWTLYEQDSTGIGAAFANAERLARSAADWLALAREARLHGGTGELPRRALDRAAELATAADDKSRIGAAYVDWFADDAAAARLGPRGVRPDELCPSRARLDEWRASSSAAFDVLRERVAKETLAQIAAADYGHDRERHLAALEHICKSGLVPLELDRQPREVLELTRWAPAHNDVEHGARALSCVLLCLRLQDGDDLVNIAPALIESAVALGEGVAPACEGLFAWLHDTADVDGNGGLLALFSLFILRAQRVPADPRLPALLQRMSDASDVGALREWLAQSLQKERWQRLIDAALARIGKDQPSLAPLCRRLGFPV